MMEYIKLENVNKKYDSKFVLRDINLQINSNGIFGLVGPNGAGKTTLFRLLMGLIQPTSGNVFILNESPSYKNASKISFCSDGDYLYDDLTAEENLNFIVESYNIADSSQKLTQLAKKLNIESDLNKISKNLSKGMRKKISIIRSLLIDADIYIFDEPMSWLDYETQKILIDIIKKLGEDRLVLVSSHNLLQLEKLCHNIIILNRDIKFSGNINGIKRDN